jgi:predicted GIY-YIG superfamily endonuclease
MKRPDLTEKGLALQASDADANEGRLLIRLSMWYVYILKSTVTGKLYTGIALDPQARLAKHNAGKGAKFTRTGRPWAIVYIEPAASQGDALRRELAIKALNREAKLQLVKG